MAEPVKITVVPRVPSSITLESGKNLYGVSTGQSIEINTSTGRYSIDSVSGRDLLNMGISVATSWSTSNPSNQAYSITLPANGPFYLGWDTQRGLIVGGRYEAGNSSLYADLGISFDTPANGSNVFGFGDADTYVTFSDGKTELSNSFVALPGGGRTAIYRDSSGAVRASSQPFVNPMGIALGNAWARCFIAGTKIRIDGNLTKNIEDISIGDVVSCFDENSASDSPLRCGVVKRVFRNVSETIIDLRGTFCTPGHVFLSTSGDCLQNGLRFDTIGRILRDDACIVDECGKVIRARTGAFFGSGEDQLVRIRFCTAEIHSDSTHERVALVRAGIPLPRLASESGHVSVEAKLIDFLNKNRLTILPDGSLLDDKFRRFEACDWPIGIGPAYNECAENWIVEIDGGIFIPQWIDQIADKTDDNPRGVRHQNIDLIL